jgi:uncharacterized OsmC-like protein
MTSQSTYLGNLRTESVHLQSGTTIITDAPVDNHGKGEAFSPTDLVANALGNCMMTLMGIYAQRENIDLVGTKISMTKIMADSPRRISEIQLIFDFPATLQVTPQQRQALENAARTCPVIKSLHPDIKETLTFNFPA